METPQCVPSTSGKERLASSASAVFLSPPTKSARGLSLASLRRSINSFMSSRRSAKSDDMSPGRENSPTKDYEGRNIFWGQIQGRVEDKYALGEEIGRGAFGVCRRAQASRCMSTSAWLPHDSAVYGYENTVANCAGQQHAPRALLQDNQ